MKRWSTSGSPWNWTRLMLPRTNLGQMLLDRNQAEEALPHCQEAVRLQPNMAALHHNLGNALRQL